MHLDTIVIFVFSLIIVVVGFLLSRSGKNIKDYFSGNASVPWILASLSLFMGFFSAGTFVAWGSIAYESGWVAVTMQWTMGIGALIVGLFIAPKWKESNNFTAAEFIKERLGDVAHKMYVYIFLLVSLLIKGSVLYSVALLVSSSLGFPLIPTTIVLGVLMIAYTAAGGIWAVMVIDILQFVVLSVAVLILIPLSFDEIGGVKEFISKVPSNFFSFTNSKYNAEFILGFILYHIFYIGGNWTFVQRYTCVKDKRSSRKVAYLFAILYFISPIVWMLPPMIYRVINPNLVGVASENAYMLICQKILPPGLLGLILTGMYFSTSASANTALNVSAAILTHDIYQDKINKSASDKKLMQVAKVSTWILGLGMIVVALVIQNIGGIVPFILGVAAITGGPTLVPPIWALFSKKINSKHVIWATIIGLAFNVLFKVYESLQGSYSYAHEMLLGVSIPLVYLFVVEFLVLKNNSADYESYKLISANRKQKVDSSELVDDTEAILNQSKYALKILGLALMSIAFVLIVLSLFMNPTNRMWLWIMSLVVILIGCIPLVKSKKSL